MGDLALDGLFCSGGCSCCVPRRAGFRGGGIIAGSGFDGDLGDEPRSGEVDAKSLAIEGLYRRACLFGWDKALLKLPSSVPVPSLVLLESGLCSTGVVGES